MRELPTRETWELTGHGDRIVNVHPRSTCETSCPLHNPSDHHMRSWPATFDGWNRLIMRECEHGIYHPDPDSLDWWFREFPQAEATRPETTQLLHSGYTCDGCCA